MLTSGLVWLLAIAQPPAQSSAPPAPGSGRATPTPAPPPIAGRTPARQIAGSISSDDYPAAALAAREQGAVRVRLSVSADGRVSECQVVESSGSSTLDIATCSLLAQRLVYEPARNERGEAVAAHVVRRVNWTLPQDGQFPFAPFTIAFTAALEGGVARSCAVESDGQTDPKAVAFCEQVLASIPVWPRFRGQLSQATHLMTFVPAGAPPPTVRPAWGERLASLDRDLRIAADGRLIECGSEPGSAPGAANTNCQPAGGFVFQAAGEQAERRGRLTITLFGVRR